jgi:ribokinase
MKIYNLGSLNIDYVYAVEHFVQAGETLSSKEMRVFPGGKGLNQSIALARAGAQVIHGAVVGDNGDFLLQVMADSGVDISRIQRVSGSCGHAIIQVDGAGQNCILLYAGTNHMVDRAYAEEFLWDAMPGDILLLQNEVSGLRDIFELAAQKGMRIAFNPSPYHENLKKLPLSYVTWWFCNEVEGEALFGSGDPAVMAERFWQQYPHSNLVLTLGSYGCAGWAVFRSLSRNTYARYQENRKFLQFFEKIKDRDHRYFDCPRCRQTTRVPRGKGKIAITCPKCKERFIRKT